MKRSGAVMYALFITALLIFGIVTVFYFAWKIHYVQAILALVGVLLSFILAPTLHELGHLWFAKSAKMECVFIKFFCFKLYRKSGKLRFGFASPFSADQTQVVPKTGGNMRNRARLYALGGLICSGACLVAFAVSAVVLALVGRPSFVFFGVLPYFGYLFLLNVLPLEYASGKTDVLIAKGIKNSAPAERTMVAAMEIQGQLYEGKSYAEIDESLYFDLPQLCEDEPMFAVILDLRYRYYLEKEDLEKAGDCLNRLAQIQCYIPDKEIEKLAAELTYMHCLLGDVERATESGKLCAEYLQGDSVLAKRVLLAFSLATGKTEAVEPLIKQASEAIKTERLEGVRKYEELLLSRLQRV